MPLPLTAMATGIGSTSTLFGVQSLSDVSSSLKSESGLTAHCAARWIGQRARRTRRHRDDNLEMTRQRVNGNGSAGRAGQDVAGDTAGNIADSGHIHVTFSMVERAVSRG